MVIHYDSIDCEDFNEKRTEDPWKVQFRELAFALKLIHELPPPVIFSRFMDFLKTKIVAIIFTYRLIPHGFQIWVEHLRL